MNGASETFSRPVTESFGRSGSFSFTSREPDEQPATETARRRPATRRWRIRGPLRVSVESMRGRRRRRGGALHRRVVLREARVVALDLLVVRRELQRALVRGERVRG